MTSMPLVSVIIPTYNRPEYLREAIACVLAQTYSPVEVIVSDDASAESPADLVASFGDPRVRLRRNAQNLGIARNAMAAFQEAKGEWVASLNDDDLWHPEFLATLMPPLIAQPELVMAFCDYALVHEDGSLDPEATARKSREEKRDRLRPGIHQPCWEAVVVDQSAFVACAAVLRRDAVDWEQLPVAGVFWDYFTAYLACRAGGGAYYCPQRLAMYRQSPISILRSPNPQTKIRNAQAAIACYERFGADEQLRPFWPEFRRRWAEEHTNLGIGLLRAGDRAAARPYFQKALRAQGFNLRTLAAWGLSWLPERWVPALASVPNPARLLSQ